MSILRYKQKLLADGGVFRTGGGGSGGGGSPAPQQNTTVNTNIPEYAKPYVETMLGTAQQQIYNYDNGTVTGFKPYVPYGATVDANGNITNTAQEQAQAAVAPFSPLQQTSFYNAGNLGLPGQYNTGTGYAALGGIGSANIANQAANAGNQYNMMATNPYATQAFMSPYIQNALQPQLREMNRQYDITGMQMQGKAVGQGAFGGNRAALEQAENQRNKNIAMNQAIGTGYQNAFQAAQQAQQYGANLGVQGYNTALQGTQQLTGAGTALANIGSAQLQGQQNIIGLQNQMGSQQQTQQQNMINQAMQNYAMQQQYPNQQLAFMSGLTRGLPMQTATTQSYQAAPSAISQISGLGLTGAAAYGLMKKEGGVIKSYAQGGNVDMDPDGADLDNPQGFVSGGIAQAITNRVRMNPDGYSKQAIDKSTKSGLVDDLVGLAAIQEKNKQEKERQAQAAMMQPKPPTVKDQILAERAALDQQRGIEMAQSNLPTEYAGGGIIAFDEGGSTMGGFETDSGAYGSQARPKIDEYVIDPMTGEKLFSGRGKPEEAPAVPKDNMFVDRSKSSASAAAGTKPASKLEVLTGAPEMKTDTGGIDEIIKQSISDLKAGETESKNARKEAKLMGLLGAGLGIMGGTSPFAAVNFKGAMPALQGYQEEMRGIRADDQKRLAQISALNLKGAELKQELKKLGITENLSNAQIKELLAKASYYNQRGAGIGGAGIANIPPAVYDKVAQRYEEYKTNPMTSPVFSSLPPKVQEGFKQGYKPNTQSYQNLMSEYNRYADAHMNQYLNTMQSRNVKARPEVE